MAQNYPDSLCVFTQRTNGIYEIAFKKASRQAIDSFWEHLEGIFEVAAGHEIICCLMDWRQVETPPLQYMAQRARQLSEIYPNGPKTRLAILHQPGTLLNMAQTMAKFTRSEYSVRRFFPEDQYDEAVAWLLEG